MIEKLIQSMKEEYIDGMFISNPQDVQYVSNHKGNEAFVIITLNNKYLITDPRYVEQASYESPDFEIVNWNRKNMLMSIVNKIVIDEKVKRLGFEAEYITYSQFTEMFDLIEVEITPVIDIVRKIREIKTDEEIKYLREACEITGRAFKLLLDDIKAGISEIELSAKAGYYMRMEGGDAISAENIILSGNRTSLLMDKPSKKKIEKGDFILINIGAKYNGYCCDFSRTVVLGKPKEEQVKMYETIIKAYDEMMKTIKHGISGVEPYLSLKKVMDESKYKNYFYSGIGHGVGLFLYEEPFLGPVSKSILKARNVMTVEPGIYIPGWGGMRIEDQILVKENGYEYLANITREMISI